LLPFLYIGYIRALTNSTGTCSPFHTLHQYMDLPPQHPASTFNYAVTESSNGDLLFLTFPIIAETSGMEGALIFCSGPE